MSTLIDEAMAAHGGLETWRALTRFEGHMSGGGPLFDGVGQPNGIRDLNFEGLCQQQRMSCWPIGPGGLRSLIKPKYEALLNDAGEIVHERTDPESGFAKASPGELTRWDDLNLAWFIGYAMWNYQNVPFIWTWPGVETQELSPIENEGRSLRRLLVRYPDSIATHSREEIFYVSDAGLIERVDYAPIVTGGRLAANFTSEHTEVPGGLVVPLRRVVHTRDPDGIVKRPPIIDITIDALAYT